MKVDAVSVGSYQKKLQVNVPAGDVKGEVDAYYRDLRKRVRLPGFRPGKAPRKVLEMKFGKQVRSDVADNLVQQGYSQAIEEHSLEPVSAPIVDRGPLKDGEDFDFTITVEVRPDIALENYQGLEVIYPTVEVADAEIDAVVDQRVEGERRLVSVDDRPVQAGDKVIAALTAREGDEEIASELGTMLSTDAEVYYKGIEGFLVGLELGAESTATVKFADDALATAVAGKELEVTLTVSSIQVQETPELTDELAEELGFTGGIEGMRFAIRGQIQDQREELSRNQARANALQVIIDANPFEVPDALIDQQLEALQNELRLQEAYKGRDPRTLRFSEAQLADLRNRATFAAKGGLILEWVAETEDLTVTDADLEAKYQELAIERDQTVESVRGWFVKEDAVDELRARLLEEKTLDWMLEHSELVAPGAAEEPVEVAADDAADVVSADEASAEE